jgi:molybdate transport system substrate-binding protein
VICFVAVGASGATSQAADLAVVSSQGAVSGLSELAPAFAKATGHKLVISQEGGPALEKKLASASAPVDLIVLNTGAMNNIIKQGRVLEGSNRVFARAAVGLSVKTGAPWPDISTPEALRRTLLEAKSVGYSFGGSGSIAARAIEKLGIAEQLKTKTVRTDGPAAAYIMRGEVEMVIQQVNISKPIPGTDYVGNLPGDLHDHVVFAIAVGALSKQQEAARAFIQFAASPEAGPLLQKGMMEGASR